MVTRLKVFGRGRVKHQPPLFVCEIESESVMCRADALCHKAATPNYIRDVFGRAENHIQHFALLFNVRSHQKEQ